MIVFLQSSSITQLPARRSLGEGWVHSQQYTFGESCTFQNDLLVSLYSEFIF